MGSPADPASAYCLYVEDNKTCLYLMQGQLNRLLVDMKEYVVAQTKTNNDKQIAINRLREFVKLT